MKRHTFPLNKAAAAALLTILLLSLIPPIPVNMFPVNEPTPSLREQLGIPIESDVVIERVDYTVTNNGGAFQGYTLFVLNERDRILGNNSNMVLIMDMDGNVVASKQVGSDGGANCPAEFIDPNTVLVGTQTGAALWHLGNDTLQYVGFKGHHEYEYNPNRNTIYTFNRLYLNIGGINYLFDKINEVNMTGHVIWSWNVSDFISENWWCPSHDSSGIYRDISHSNTIYYDAEEDIIYYNSRNTNTFFKLKPSTKEVLWSIGEYGDFTMYDIRGNPINHMFFHAHSVEPIDENTFILFDNDYHNQTSTLNRISRILEIKINETTKTANETWIYEASSAYFSAGWGDADRLPNGNRIGTWGYPSLPTGAPSASLIEVNDDHDVVWKLDLNYDIYHYYGVYRSERFRFTPSISSPEDVETMNSTNQVSWDVLYNFRNKRPIPGNYTFYIDGVPSQYGVFNYTKYWRPTTITIDTGLLTLGIHNLTLEIDDGYGNKVSDAVNMTVKNFNIARTGLTTIEKGQTTNLPTWSGFALSELFCNISLNGTLYDEFNWTGQEIVLDPAVISLGSHLVQLQLFNGSLRVYDDTFWLQVDPTAAPVITPMQTSTISITWGDPLILSWELSDSTPHSWSILVDDVEVNADVWSESPLLLNWDVPHYLDGEYNITLVAHDLLGQWTKSETILTVYPPSHPYFLSWPDDTTIAWGLPGISFEWETYNADTWDLLRNGTSIEDGDASSGDIEFTITDWQGGNWRPGAYNMTLVLSNLEYSASNTFWFAIVADPGDPYADAVVTDRSEWYLMGENAIGAPDGLYATIYVDYADGYLSMDMGEGEEIVDGAGYDFTVYTNPESEYRISVCDSEFMSFLYVGTATGTASFDLSISGLEKARFVRVTYIFGPDVQLDAIVANYHNTPSMDTDSPRLTVYGDWHKVESGLNLTLLWIASDLAPWSYEVYLNSSLVTSEVWYGSNIEYLFHGTSVGWWNVTLVAYDAFGNIGVDTVMVEVYASPSPDILVILLVGSLGVGVAAGLVVLVLAKKRYVTGGS